MNGGRTWKIPSQIKRMEKENMDFLGTQDVAGGIQVEVISFLVFHFLEINSVLKDP